jgi:hypothetical protein
MDTGPYGREIISLSGLQEMKGGLLFLQENKPIITDAKKPINEFLIIEII